METNIGLQNGKIQLSLLEQKYNTVLEQYEDITQRIQSFEDFMYETYSIKKKPRLIDLDFEVVQQLISNKFNEEVQRIRNQFNASLQKANDDKGKLQTKLHTAKQKQDKLTEQKKVLAVEKQKLNKRIQTYKSEVQEKNKRLQNGKKKISTLEQQLSSSISQNKKLQTKFNQSQQTVNNLRQKLKNKQLQMQTSQINFLNKIKQLNQQIGIARNKHHELQFNVKQVQQSMKIMQLQNKKKIQDLNVANQKKVRQTISTYEKQIQKKKKEFDSLYSIAAIKNQKAIKTLKQKNQQEIKKQMQEYQIKLEVENQRYIQLRDLKWNNQQTLESKIKHLETQNSQIRIQIQQNTDEIKILKQTLQQTIKQHVIMSKKLQQATVALLSETQSFNKQKQQYQHRISSILQQKQTQNISQEKIFKETLSLVQFDYKQKINSLRIKGNEEVQTAKNIVRNQMMDMEQKHQKQLLKMSEQVKRIKSSYDSIHDVYQNKFKTSEKTYKQHTNAINKRKEYQMQVITQLKEKQKTQMKTHYEAIIHKYEKQFKAKVQEQKLLVTMEKDDIIQKQKIFYQEQIKSLARSIQIAGNQKVLGVERKVKFVEKKLRDLEVEYQLIVKQKQILSKTSNNQLQSMKQLQQLIKEQVQKMQHKYNELQTKSQTQRYQFQEQITRLLNEIQQNKRQYNSKEQLIIDSCKARITKNQCQMKEFGTKIKKQFQDLQYQYNQRYNVLAKSYKQLQFLSGQKTSLPQDIEIMKVLHKGLIQKQQELKKAKQLAADLKKQLLSKQHTNKIFSMKKLDMLGKMNTGHIGNYLNTVYK